MDSSKDDATFCWPSGQILPSRPSKNTVEHNHRKINLNQYFENGAAIIDPVFPQSVPLTPINLPPQQMVLELTEIHENLTECV